MTTPRFIRLLFTVLLGALLWAGSPPSVSFAQSDNTASAKKKKRKRARRARRRRARARARAEAREPAVEAPVAESAEPGEGAPAESDSESETVAESSAGASARGAGGSMRRSNRMEFDARLVRGETAGSGAVILFDRGSRQLPRLTRQRKRFLEASLRPVLGTRAEQARAVGPQPAEAPAPETSPKELAEARAGDESESE